MTTWRKVLGVVSYLTWWLHPHHPRCSTCRKLFDYAHREGVEKGTKAGFAAGIEIAQKLMESEGENKILVGEVQVPLRRTKEAQVKVVTKELSALKLAEIEAILKEPEQKYKQ